MTWAALPTPSRSSDHGEVRFVGPEVLREFLAAADEDGFLTVALTPPGPGQRGRLGLVIEDAIETALQRRGACAPGVGASTNLDASLSDQLYRARLIELRGVAVALPSLEGIANLAGALDAEDSAVVRWWIGATLERPVRVYFDAGDRYLGVYGAPIAFHQLLSAPATSRILDDEPTPELAPEVTASSAAMELSDLPPTVGSRESCSELESELDAELAAELAEAEREAAFAAKHRECAGETALAADFSDAEPDVSETESDLSEAEPNLTNVDPTPLAAPLPFEPLELQETPVAHATEEPQQTDSDPIIEECLLQAMREIAPDPRALVREAVTPIAEEALPFDHASEDSATTLLPPVEPKQYLPLYANAAEEWRTWVHELEGVRGPKPLAVVERMFVTSYVPLSDAVARGIGGADAERALDSWGSSFEQSYKEAFDALRVRGKRPTMVLDVPDLALRIGRLHGARSVQLIVVDGMRFDLGLRIEQRLRKGLGQGVALTERLLLWSALPSTTDVQLELIGRGPEALREFTGEVNSEVPVARGRNAATLRRIRAGHRELFKLDMIEASLSEPGGPEAERLDDLADDTATTLINYFQRLAARTLVMVFGDHGFLLDPREGGTTAARHGGASPEEVLVPAFAWLVGGVH